MSLTERGIERRCRWRGASGSGTGIADSSARVYGCCGRGEQRRRRSDLDDLPEIHDRDAAADVLDEPQIVRDEQVGELQPLLQIHQQVDDLRLHRHVERGHRLVEDDERRVERKRAGQADPLPLAAAELMRVALEMRRVETDQLEQLGDTRSRRSARRPEPWMMSGSSTICRARMRGFSDEYGSWKTICMSRRAARIRRRENASTFSPRNRTSPDVGSMRRRMQRPVVVLPLPDSPTRPNVSPSSMLKLTSSTARTTASPARKSPLPRAKCFTRWRDFDERHQRRVSSAGAARCAGPQPGSCR